MTSRMTALKTPLLCEHSRVGSELGNQALAQFADALDACVPTLGPTCPTVVFQRLCVFSLLPPHEEMGAGVDIAVRMPLRAVLGNMK